MEMSWFQWCFYTGGSRKKDFDILEDEEGLNNDISINVKHVLINLIPSEIEETFLRKTWSNVVNVKFPSLENIRKCYKLFKMQKKLLESFRNALSIVMFEKVIKS